MKFNRRKLLQSAALMAADAAQAAPSGSPDWSKVRNDFPWLKEQLWLTAADYHPVGIHSLRASAVFGWKFRLPTAKIIHVYTRQ